MKNKRLEIFSRSATGRGASREGSLHGATISNDTGLPRKAAATTRSVSPPPPGIGPVNSAIASKGTVGSQAGSDATKDFASSPASENSALQSGDRAAGDFERDCGGTATNERNRPSGSRTTVNIPVTSSGGSDRLTSPSEFAGRSGRGLCRYSNSAGFHQPVARSRAQPGLPVRARCLR